MFRCVEEVCHGPGVSVENFGGEGTGLKSMMDFPWLEGEEVTFSVTGQKDGQHWKVSCEYEYRGETTFMATYRRKGNRPLSQVGNVFL